MKNELINQIIEMEWELFQQTQNVGGRAWCQDDKVQFDANRKAQFDIWDEKTLQLYLQDLQEAESGHFEICLHDGNNGAGRVSVAERPASGDQR